MSPRSTHPATKISKIQRRIGAFSLVELVIVIVMVGIIAAIAVPRFSEADESANQRELDNSRFVLQNAVDLYVAEHTASYFDYDGNGAVSSQDIADSLLKHTTARGTAFAGSGLAFGPYLKNLFDNTLQGPGTGGIAVDPTGDHTTVLCGSDGGLHRWDHCGWTLDLATWQIRPAHPGPDAPGMPSATTPQ